MILNQSTAAVAHACRDPDNLFIQTAYAWIFFELGGFLTRLLSIIKMSKSRLRLGGRTFCSGFKQSRLNWHRAV